MNCQVCNASTISNPPTNKIKSLLKLFWLIHIGTVINEGSFKWREMRSMAVTTVWILCQGWIERSFPICVASVIRRINLYSNFWGCLEIHISNARLPLRVQLCQFCSICPNAFHVVEDEIYLFQRRWHDINKVAADGLDYGLCCLLLWESSFAATNGRQSQRFQVLFVSKN